jgi:hypothetical protein
VEVIAEEFGAGGATVAVEDAEDVTGGPGLGGFRVGFGEVQKDRNPVFVVVSTGPEDEVPHCALVCVRCEAADDA